MRDASTPEPSANLLTPRQLEVLELMAKGLTNREIAGVLDVTQATVKTHVAAVVAARDCRSALRSLFERSGSEAPGGRVRRGSHHSPVGLAMIPGDLAKLEVRL